MQYVSSKLYHPNIASVIKYFLFNEVFVGVNTFLTKKGQFQCLRCKLLNFYKAGKFRGGIIFKYPSVYSRLQYRHVYSFQEQEHLIFVHVCKQPVHTSQCRVSITYLVRFYLVVDFLELCQNYKDFVSRLGKGYFPIK